MYVILGHITFGAHNIDNDSIIETLKEIQSKSLINKLCRPIEESNTTSKTPKSTFSQSKAPPAELKKIILSPLMILLISLLYSSK